MISIENAVRQNMSIVCIRQPDQSYMLFARPYRSSDFTRGQNKDRKPLPLDPPLRYQSIHDACDKMAELNNIPRTGADQ